MHQINIVVIKDSVIDENYLIQGEDKDEVVERANQKFLDLCKSNVPNWNHDNIQRLAQALDDGYVEFGSGFGSICISHPDSDC